MISLCTCKGTDCGCPIPEIAGIYFRNKGKTFHSVEDTLDLLELVKIDINNIRRNPYAPYWEFLEEVVDNIATGKWKSHPYNWKPYIMNASYLPLAEHDIDRRSDALRNKCINMLRDLNLPIGELNNRQILLKWIRNPNGFDDIMSVVKTMIELNKLFSKKGK